MRIGAVVSVACVLLCAGAASALTADESGGDFDSAYARAPVFELDLGINTVSGVYDGPEDDEAFRRDSFFITVPNGAILRSGSLTLTNRSGDFNGTTYELSILFTFLSSQTFAGPGSASTVFESLMPLVADTYFFNNVALTSATGAIDTEWSFAFDVAAVPVPPAAPLLIGAVAALGLLRRRRAG